MRDPNRAATPPDSRYDDMRRLDGGRFRMGSDAHYPEEAPMREVEVGGFWIDRTPVTNHAFARFVAETGYATLAERPPDPRAYPDADPALLVPGSAVFTPPGRPVSLDDERAWWRYVPGACWRLPAGPDGSPAALLHPVVHVALEDAEAYAAWAGKDIPTEAEWELAARGGLDGAEYAWGDELRPGGAWLANTWQGLFPHRDTAEDGFAGTSPVGAFPPNGYGLLDMIGNVWEWTSSPGAAAVPASCCAPAPRPDAATRVIKGGSYLCAPSYCARYRPAARQLLPADSTTGHLGFRCVAR
jgi:formylglycine-generating enzyme